MELGKWKERKGEREKKRVTKEVKEAMYILY